MGRKNWNTPRPYVQPHRMRSERPHTATETIVTYTTGSGNETVPANVVLTKIRLNGAGGGGGGGGNEKDELAGGGGGGGYAEYVLPTPAVTGTIVAYSVGAGGAEGIAPGNGSTGGASTVTTYSLTANGGQGGFGNGGSGGNGGTASGGTTNTTGGSGAGGGEDAGAGGTSANTIQLFPFAFAGYGGGGGEEDTNGNIGQPGRVSFYYSALE